jgi:hypothetical protein
MPGGRRPGHTTLGKNCYVLNGSLADIMCRFLKTATFKLCDEITIHFPRRELRNYTTFSYVSTIFLTENFDKRQSNFVVQQNNFDERQSNFDV